MSGQLAVAWAPLLSWWIIAALAVATAAVLALGIYRRASGIWWRGLAAATLLMALANPSAVREEREPIEDVAFVVVDDSRSQDIEPRPAQREAALAHLTARLEALPNTQVRVLHAGRERLHEEGGTRLFESLRQALGEVSRESVGGIFLITDGQVHDVPESYESLAVEAPLHVFLTGLPEEGDRRLTLEQVPSFGIVGRQLSMTLRVDDLPGENAPVVAEVRIRQDGGEEKLLRVPVGVSHEVTFELNHRGPTILEVEAEAGERELSLYNNRAAVVVNGVRDRLRVLLVSGEPHPGERAWRNILKSDPSVDLVHFTILRPPEKQDGTPIRELSLIAFPTRELFEVKLDEFDLVIFDRYRRRGVLPSLYLENIARYVESGGALLEAVGPTFATPLSLYRTPLGRVLPAAPTGGILERPFVPSVTETGERHPVTAELGTDGVAAADAGEWGRWFRQIETEAQQGTVLMDGSDSWPLLILDRVGEGRVAQLTSDQIWLWSRGYEGGGPQAELVRRIAHWLMREPDLEEEDLRATVDGERLEITRRSLSEELPELEVTKPDGTVETVSLTAGGAGRASARVPVDQPGLYRVSDGEKVALAAAGPLNSREFEDPRSSSEALRPLAEASGGGEIILHEAALPDLRKVRPDRDRAGDTWLGVIERGGFIVSGIDQVPLLPGLLALVLAFGGLLAAWRTEGR